MTAEKLEKIYNEAYKPVYWTAMQMLKNQADAEDVVQDTFVSFIESYGDMEDTGKAVALLKKIAANKCLDRIKLSRTDAVEDEFFEDVEAVPEDFLPDSIIESEDARRIVMNIISNSLSDDVRRTLVMFYFDDMSTKEIADALGVPQGTVLRRLNSARNKIKKEVEKYEEDNKTKLFGMAAPFLSKLFMKEASQVAFKPMPAKLINLSASTQASNAGAATKVASAAAKKGTGLAMNKILIGTISGVVITGAAVGIVLGVMAKKADTKPTVEDTTIEEEVEVSSEEDVTEPSQSDEKMPSASADGPFDPNAMVFEEMPSLYGKQVTFACTIGELRNMGFDYFEDGQVEDDGSVWMTCDDGYAFACYLMNPEQQTGTAANDAVILGIEVFMVETELDFYDISLDMKEKDFTAACGTPAYVIGEKTDRTFYYYFFDKTGYVYEFCFVNTTGNPDDAKLMTIAYGHKDYMYTRAPLSEEI